MKNWVLVVEIDLVGQVMLRKDNDREGNFGLMLTAYSEIDGKFVSSYVEFGGNEDLRDENFDMLASEEGHKTINRIAEQLIMF